MNRKASMQLSINMIVILIIAVVILGLALTFIQGMFRGIEKDFISRANEEPNPSSATPSNPLTCSRGANILSSPGEELSLKWGVYCTDSNDCEGTSLDSIVCSGGLLTITSIVSTTKNISYASSDMLITLVSIPKATTLNKYLCTAIVKHGTIPVETASKDMIIEVVK